MNILMQSFLMFLWPISWVLIQRVGNEASFRFGGCAFLSSQGWGVLWSWVQQSLLLLVWNDIFLLVLFWCHVFGFGSLQKQVSFGFSWSTQRTAGASAWLARLFFINRMSWQLLFRIFLANLPWLWLASLVVFVILGELIELLPH